MDENFSEDGIKIGRWGNEADEKYKNDVEKEDKTENVVKKVDTKASLNNEVGEKKGIETEDNFDHFSRNEISFELKNFLNKNLTISRIRAHGVSKENSEKPRLSNGEGSLNDGLDKNAQGFGKEEPDTKAEEYPTKETEDDDDEEVEVAEEEEEEDEDEEDEEEEEEEAENDDDDDDGAYFNPMADCVILEEGDECLQFDDRPSDSDENPPLPAVNGNYVAVTTTAIEPPASKRKKRIPSKVLSDTTSEDPCEVIWSDPSENGSCRVCRGHCPGPKCRKCRAVDVQGRKRYVCLLCEKTINHMGNFGQHVRSHVSPICHICHKSFKLLRKLEQHMQFHRKKMGMPMKKRRKQKTPVKIETTVDVHMEEEAGPSNEGDVGHFSNENSMSPPYETNGDICELLQVDILNKSDDIMSNGKDNSHEDNFNSYDDEDDDDNDGVEDEEGEQLDVSPFKEEMDVNEQINAMDLSMSTGHGDEIYQCEYCFGTNCQPNKCLKSKVETVEERTTYECLICGKVIVNHRGNFKQHVRSHTDFSCKLCGKKFNDALKLKKHSELHTKEKCFPCDVCSKTFRVLHHLTMHKERAHLKDKTFDCSNCDRIFPSRGELMSHIRWSHMGPDRPFQCQLCQKTFAYKNNLKIHMRIHTNDKPYACKVCGRAFTQSSSLKMHMTVHAFNRNVFKCGACDKSFPYASNLKLHVKSAHSGLNPARRKSTTCSCHLCGLGFTHRNSLKAHMRTAHAFYDYANLEEQTEKAQPAADPETKLTSRKDNKHRPHICPTCGKGFTQRGSLRTHMRVLHNSYLVPIPVTRNALPFLTSLLPPEISVEVNPAPASLPSATPSRTPQSHPNPSPESESQATNNNFDESQFLKCGICGSLFSHYEHLESHICIHSV